MIESKKVKREIEIKTLIGDANDALLKGKMEQNEWAEKIKHLMAELRDIWGDETITMTQERWAADIQEMMLKKGGLIDRLCEAVRNKSIIQIVQSCPVEAKNGKVLAGEFINVLISYKNPARDKIKATPKKAIEDLNA